MPTTTPPSITRLFHTYALLSDDLHTLQQGRSLLDALPEQDRRLLLDTIHTMSRLGDGLTFDNTIRLLRHALATIQNTAGQKETPPIGGKPTGGVRQRTGGGVSGRADDAAA